jgi:RNA polymerase sigma factor (sigma-70 family)
MNFVLTNIKRNRKKYPAGLGHKNGDRDKIQSRFLSLEKYHELACRIIGRFAPVNAKKMMLESEDAISFIAHQLMKGDWGFEPSKGVKISSLRGYIGRVAIKEYLKTLSTQRRENETIQQDIEARPNTVNPEEMRMRIETDQETRDYIRGLLYTLNDVQRACISLHYLDGLKQTDVARKVGLSREGVRKAISEGMKRLNAMVTGDSNE